MTSIQMICYDREFPESARILMLQGAELILVPNACGLDLNRLAQILPNWIDPHDGGNDLHDAHDALNLPPPFCNCD